MECQQKFLKYLKINLFKINWDNSDIKAVNDVIKRGKDWAMGKEIGELENAVSKYVGVKYGVAFNSGTSALHALMLAYGIGPYDEVIVPSFTFIATANCVLFVGTKPVFADIEGEYYGLDPLDVLNKITPKTKAIIAVHYGGCPCRIKELKAIAKKAKILLIEDACESLGAKLNGKMIGSFGDSSVFSFCQNKIITGGEGGMVVTNNKKLAEKLRQIRNHGKIKEQYVSLGYNFRMPTILAALILSQFKRIEKIIQKRIANAEYLNKKITHIEIKASEDLRDVFQLYTIRFCKNRDKRKKELEKAGIQTKIYFEPIHLTPFYKSFGYREGSLPVTEQISKEVLTLPMYPDLNRKEMDFIATKIWKMIS